VAKDLKAAANDAGLVWRTVQRASTSLHIRRPRAGFGKGSTWSLPPPEGTAAIRATRPKGQTCGTVGTNGKTPRKIEGSQGDNAHSCHNSEVGTNGDGHRSLSRRELKFMRARIQAAREEKPWFRRIRDRNGT